MAMLTFLMLSLTKCDTRNNASVKDIHIEAIEVVL